MVDNIPVGIAPLGVAINPITNIGYVANSNSNSVSIIDIGHNKVIKNIPLTGIPVDLAVNPNTNTVYVVTMVLI